MHDSSIILFHYYSHKNMFLKVLPCHNAPNSYLASTQDALRCTAQKGIQKHITTALYQSGAAEDN